MSSYKLIDHIISILKIEKTELNNNEDDLIKSIKRKYQTFNDFENFINKNFGKIIDNLNKSLGRNISINDIYNNNGNLVKVDTYNIHEDFMKIS